MTQAPVGIDDDFFTVFSLPLTNIIDRYEYSTREERNGVNFIMMVHLESSCASDDDEAQKLRLFAVWRKKRLRSNYC
jgi:hypothetical protein